MYYLFSKVFSYEETCMVEADSLEEAKKNADKDEHWLRWDDCFEYERYYKSDDDEYIRDEEPVIIKKEISMLEI